MFTDNVDKVITELEDIRKTLQGGDNSQGGAVQRPMRGNAFNVVETSDLPADMTNEDETVTVGVGDREVLAEFDVGANTAHIHAVGAADAQGVKYGLIIDENIHAGSWTQSPLGTMHQPFSFNQHFQAYLTAGTSVKYVAWNEHGTESHDLTARIHLEVLP